MSTTSAAEQRASPLRPPPPHAPRRPRLADGIFVAASAWHQFVQIALDQMGKGDEWYTPPAGVQEADENGRPAWFLPGTSAATPAPPLRAAVHSG